MARSESSEKTCPDVLGHVANPLSGSQRETFQRLKASEGLRCFSLVHARLYRGGQPSTQQLADLKALGVTTIISLRREDSGITAAERAEALRLGLKFLHFPFYGIFGASHAFVDRVLEEMRDPDNGIVYIHCQRGRDRTSLLVALHLVIDHAWHAELAWQQAVLDYGFRLTFWYRRMRRVFATVVGAHKKKVAAERPTS